MNLADFGANKNKSVLLWVARRVSSSTYGNFCGQGARAKRGRAKIYAERHFPRWGKWSGAARNMPRHPQNLLKIHKQKIPRSSSGI